MTVTIDLPNREAFDALPDVFFWPVPTVGVWYYGESKDDDVYGAGPDPEWVKAGEPCELCGGGLWLAEYNGMDPKPRRVKCRKCIDGKPRIAITVPCGRCGGSAIVHREPDDRSVDYEMVDCPDCHDGRVTVSQAVIERGPFEVHDNHWSVACRKVQP